ncbi:hypothetical protein MKX03_021733, partial [Papaver bracteatum]
FAYRDMEANQFAIRRKPKRKEILVTRSLAQQARREREKQEKEQQESHGQELPHSRIPQITLVIDSVIQKGVLAPNQKKETSILRSLAQQARREKEKQEKERRERHKHGFPNNQFSQITTITDCMTHSVTQKCVAGPDQVSIISKLKNTIFVGN